MKKESAIPERVTERAMAQVARDYWLLMKPELTLLSVFTSLCSAYLAIGKGIEVDPWTLPFLVIGTLLVGGGSGALNQTIEHRFDAMMKRTIKRPIPDLRLTPRQGFIFAFTISLIGTVVLLFINVLCAFLAVTTLLSYVYLYTPLKRITHLSTIIGAIPGALPTLIGWAAVQNSLSIESLTLFAIVYYWQMPHFYSLGWMYRIDYTQAGFRFLTTMDESGKKVARHILLNLTMLFLIGISPGLVGLAGVWYIPVALLSGAWYLYYGIDFARSIAKERSTQAARKLFFASLLYIPIIFTSLILFKLS